MVRVLLILAFILLVLILLVVITEEGEGRTGARYQWLMGLEGLKKEDTLPMSRANLLCLPDALLLGPNAMMSLCREPNKCCT